MPAAATGTADNIEMSSIFGAVRASAPRLLLASVLMGGLSFAALSMLGPKYRSEAEIAIHDKDRANAAADAKGGPESVSGSANEGAINSHKRALQSDELLSKVAEALDLKEKGEFNSAKEPDDLYGSLARMIGIGGPREGESDRDRVMSVLKRQIEIYSVKDASSIGIRAMAAEPQLAADIANRIAEAYASLTALPAPEVGEQRKMLQAKIEKLTGEVTEAEADVERARGELNAATDGAQSNALNEQQLSELTGELAKAKVARSEAETRAKSAREMSKSGSAEALPEMQRSPLIQNLAQQRVRIERQISELSVTLLPAHPRMLQLDADLAGLKKQLAGEISKLVDGLEKEVKVTQGREEAIKKNLEELKAKGAAKAPDETKLHQLEANAKAKRAELESTRGQLESEGRRNETTTQLSAVELVTKAQPASVPISPKKGQSAALIAFATLLLGTFLTITRALFKGARRPGERGSASATDEASGGRKEPVLTPHPRLKEAAKKATQNVGAELAPPSPKIAAAAARLRKAAPDKGGHRAIVTGGTKGVDASTEAVALASSLSQSGANVVLVNWNLSGDDIAGLQLSKSKGICDLVSGAAGFDDVIQRLPGSKAHYIGCGRRLSDPSAIDPDQLNLILDALDEAYDHIIVTGPHEDARDLFEAIEGRFDAGVRVVDANSGAEGESAGAFLGFEVADIDVIKIEKASAPAVASAAPVQRVSRVTRQVNTRAAS